MKIRILLLFVTLSCGLIHTGCSRSPGDAWEDTKTAGRQMNKGFRTLSGGYQESRMFNNPAEFDGGYPQYSYPPGHPNYGQPYCPPGQPVYSGGSPQPTYYSQPQSYIPLKDDEISKQLKLEGNVPQASKTPGEPGSNLPGIDGFSDPVRADEVRVFQNIHFDTNDHVIRGEENKKILMNIANYMKQHQNVCLFIEGHCDKRGPAAYNLALGARRSNTVRNQLVKEGVDAERIFTISYGKERPIALGDDAESLQVNRRAQFKLYTR